jgi:hypothetical protein
VSTEPGQPHISARAAASSASSRACRTPGLEAASASSAPCLATWRMRMTVDRSIPKRSAASLWLSSPVASCSHSSYFSVGLRNRLARRPRRSRRGSCWVISTLLLGAAGPYRMRRNQNPDVGHEVRRNHCLLVSKRIDERPVLFIKPSRF